MQRLDFVLFGRILRSSGLNRKAELSHASLYAGPRLLSRSVINFATSLAILVFVLADCPASPCHVMPPGLLRTHPRPRSTPDVEDMDTLPRHSEQDAKRVVPFTVDEVTNLSLKRHAFWRFRAAVGKGFQRQTRIYRSVIPFSGFIGSALENPLVSTLQFGFRRRLDDNVVFQGVGGILCFFRMASNAARAGRPFPASISASPRLTPSTASASSILSDHS